ncbi:MAG: thymidylate synthase [Balneolaceae bacterium]|nr:thymidylate synthase [Balneolaceae bacterium]
MKQYLDLVRNVLENGVRKENRTGIDTHFQFFRVLQGGFRPMDFLCLPQKRFIFDL